VRSASKHVPPEGTSRLTQCYLASTDMEGRVMTNPRSQKTSAMREVLASNDVRTLIANQLGVDVKCVTDEAGKIGVQGFAARGQYNASRQ
jgi:hypothetical protein